MSKFKRALLVLLIPLLIVFPANAALVSCTGSPDSSGNCPIETNDSRLISYPGGGVLSKYERITTNDTLTSADSGKTFIMAPDTGSPITITLPSATTDSLGMEFRFVTDDVGAVTTGIKFFYIDPSSLDFIVYKDTQNHTNAMAAGDKLQSNGITGDSIHLINGRALFWYVDDSRGTFTDAN
jgi:hypothetical protein